MPVEVHFRYGFKSLRLALLFHISSYRYCVKSKPNRNDFVTVSFRTGIGWTGSKRMQNCTLMTFDQDCSIMLTILFPWNFISRKFYFLEASCTTIASTIELRCLCWSRWSRLILRGNTPGDKSRRHPARLQKHVLAVKGVETLPAELCKDHAG